MVENTKVKSKIEKLRYQPNKRSYYLALLAILFNVVNLFTVINSTSVTPSFEIGVKILLNIIMLLIIFLGMEKMKVYQKKWAVIIILLGALAFGRMFWMPRNIAEWSEEARIEAVLVLEENPTSDNAIKQSNKLIQKANTYDKVKNRSIIYLSIAGTLLILSGTDAYIKSKNLEQYLKEV